MDKTLHKYSSLDAMKVAEYRHWQRLPAHERLDAAWDISAEQYALKGADPDAQRLRRTLVHLQRSWG